MFLVVCIKGVVDDTMSSQSLQARTGMTYARYIWLATLLLKNKALIPFVQSLSVEVHSGYNIGIIHADSAIPYSLENYEEKLMIETAEYIVKILNKSIFLHVTSL